MAGWAGAFGASGCKCPGKFLSMEWHFTRGGDKGRKSKIALPKSDRKLLQARLDLRQPERRERTQADANAFAPFQDLGR